MFLLALSGAFANEEEAQWPKGSLLDPPVIGQTDVLLASDAPHAFHNHHLGIFTGYAEKNAKKRKDGFKVGLEYEYQFQISENLYVAPAGGVASPE